MRLILFSVIFGHLQSIAAIVCLSANSKFGHGCQPYSFQSYRPPVHHYYSPYSYNRIPYHRRARRQIYYYRQPVRYWWTQQSPQNIPFYNPYYQYRAYNYGYSRPSSYYSYNSYNRGIRRDTWGNTYIGSRSNPLWITCRTRYCSG